MSENVYWSLRINHKEETSAEKVGRKLYQKPKLEGGLYHSHEKICDILNKKFKLRTPFTPEMLEQLHKQGDRGGFKMELYTKRGSRLCSVSLWNEERLNKERMMPSVNRNYLKR